MGDYPIIQRYFSEEILNIHFTNLKSFLRKIRTYLGEIDFQIRPKNELWGGEFWSKGYYIGTVGKHGDEDVIQRYVKNQGRDKEYKVLYKEQMNIFS